MARTGATAAAATTRDSNLEGPPLDLRAASDMSRVNADHKLALWIIGQVLLYLRLFAILWRVKPFSFPRFLVKALAEGQSPMTKRHERFCRRNRQELGHDICGLAIRQETAQSG